ncbi:MAG TPA: hypothetical protein VJB66_01775 [Candidatus Nanoarchaeia archaeon]|nr:hypothetical protein [Candidatus Nanoarchaeia archaeon]
MDLETHAIRRQHSKDKDPLYKNIHVGSTLPLGSDQEIGGIVKTSFTAHIQSQIDARQYDGKTSVPYKLSPQDL